MQAGVFRRGGLWIPVAATRGRSRPAGLAPAAWTLGCKKAFSVCCRNHRMDDCAEVEIRARLTREGQRRPAVAKVDAYVNRFAVSL
jgi:hypothetical protein